MIIIVFALIGILVINSGQAAADNESIVQTSTVQKTHADSEQSSYNGFAASTMPSLLKVGGALAVVILAIYLGLFILKRMMGKKYSGNKKNNILEVLETTYIGPKKTISIIRVAGKSVLVASTENQISMLTEMDSDETKEIMREIDVEIEPDMFQNMLNSASVKIKAIAKTHKLKSLLPLQSAQKAEG